MATGAPQPQSSKFARENRVTNALAQKRRAEEEAWKKKKKMREMMANQPVEEAGPEEEEEEEEKEEKKKEEPKCKKCGKKLSKEEEKSGQGVCKACLTCKQCGRQMSKEEAFTSKNGICKICEERNQNKGNEKQQKPGKKAEEKAGTKTKDASTMREKGKALERGAKETEGAAGTGKAVSAEAKAAGTEAKIAEGAAGAEAKAVGGTIAKGAGTVAKGAATTGAKAAAEATTAAAAPETGGLSLVLTGLIMFGDKLLEIAAKIGKYVMLVVITLIIFFAIVIQSGLILGSKLLNPLNVIKSGIAIMKFIPPLMPAAYGMELGMNLANKAIEIINNNKDLILQTVGRAANLIPTTKSLVQSKMSEVMNYLNGGDGIAAMATELRELENKKESELNTADRKRRNELRKKIDESTQQAIIRVKEAQDAVRNDSRFNNQTSPTPTPQSNLVNHAKAEETNVSGETFTYFDDVKKSLEGLNMSAKLKNKVEVINAKDRSTLERYEELRKLVARDPAAETAYENHDYGASSPIKDYEDLPSVDTKVIELIDHLIMSSGIYGEGHDYLEISKINGEFTSSSRNMSTENEYAEDASDADQNNVSRHYDGRAVDISGMDNVKCTEVVYEQVPDTDFWKINWDETKPKDPLPIKFKYRTDQGLGGANGSGQGSGFDNIFNNILQGLTNGSFTIHGVLGQLPQIVLGQFFGQILQNSGINIDLGQRFPDFHGGGANLVSWITNQMVNSQWNLPANITQGTNFTNNVDNIGAATTNNVFNGVLPIASLDGDNFIGLVRNIGSEWLTEKMLLPSGSLKGDNSEKIIKRAGQRKLEVAFGLSEGSLANLHDRASLEKVIGQGYIEKTLGLAPGSFTGNIDSVVYNALFDSDRKKELVARSLGISRTDLVAGLADREFLKQKVGEEVLKQNITDFYQSTAYFDPAQNPSGSTVGNCSQEPGDNVYCLNSRDEAFDLVDYNKPYLIKFGQPLPQDITQEMLDSVAPNNDLQNPISFYLINYKYGTYGQYTPDAQPDITPIRKVRETSGSGSQNPFGINIDNPYGNLGNQSGQTGQTREYYPVDYERSLEMIQKDKSVVKKLLANGTNYDDLFKEIGMDAVAKGLSKVDKERYYIREWLKNPAGQTGDEALPKDQVTGREIFDPGVLGQRIGLKDRYDLDRIFISNRGDEVFERLGQSLFRESLNPSSSAYLSSMYLSSDESNYVPSQDTTTDGGRGNPSRILDRLDQLKTAANDLPSQKNLILVQIDIIRNVQTQPAETDNTLNNILLNTRLRKTSGSLYEIGRIIKNTPSLQNNASAQEIILIISEIIQGQDFDSLSEITADNIQISQQLSMGIDKNLVATAVRKLYQNQNGSSGYSIKDIKQDFGFRSLALALDMDKIDGSEIKTAYTDIASNPTSSNVVQKIIDNIGSDNLAKAARNLNYALNINDNNAKLNANDIAWILTGTAGRWQVLLPKVSGALSAILTNTRGNSANTDYIYNILSGVSQDPVDLSNAPVGPMNDSIDLGQMTALIGNLGSSRYTINNLTDGIKLIPNILGYVKQAGFDTSQYDALLGSFQAYYQAGAQIITTIDSFKTFFGNDGWHIADAISYASSFTNMLQENSILQAFNFVRLSFPEVPDINSYFRNLFPGLDIDFLQGLRVANFLDVIGSNDIRSWAAAIGQNIDWGSNNENARAIYNFGSQFLTGQVSQGAIFTQVEGFLRHQPGMEEMPIGFMTSMFTGNVTNMAAAVTQWGLNIGLQDGSITPEQAGYINQAIGILQSGNVTPGAIQGAAINYISANLPQWLGPDGMGLSADVAGQLTGPITSILQGDTQGAINSIQSIGMSYIQGEISNFFDEQIGATLGTTDGIRNIFGNGSLSGDLSTGGITGGLGNLGNMQNIQGTITNMGINFATSMIAGFLGEQFSGIEESLGLPQGTFTGLFAAIIPSFFIPGYSIATALISQFLPQILGNFNLGPLGFLMPFLGGGGAGQKQKEVWCAMDYYPLYDKEKVYDEEFGLSAPPDTPYDFPGATVEHGKDKALDKEKEKIGDGSGGFAKAHLDKIFINMNEFDSDLVSLGSNNERKGEFQLTKKNTTNLLKKKMKVAAEFKVKQLLGDLIRINEPDGAPSPDQCYVTEKTNDIEMLPTQIATYKEEDFSPQYLYKLNFLYGDGANKSDANNHPTTYEIYNSMKDNLAGSTRNGMWPDEEFFANFVHVGY